MLKGGERKVNFYATILNCSAPYFMPKTNKYQCTMKLIDGSLNRIPVTATIFSRTIKELPHITEMGTIIRLHRAQATKYKGQCHVNCNIGDMGAWLLFDSVKGNLPIAESGKAHTFTPNDKPLLAEIRKFTKSYFEKNEVYAVNLKEAEKNPTDFDTICEVVSIKKKGSANTVTLCDAKKTVQMDIPKNRKFPIVEGEVVHIRSANYSKKFTELELNEYSSILKVPENYKNAKELKNSIKDK